MSNHEHYGLDEGHIAGLLKRQGGGCGICGRELKDQQIDHDHTTGHIRGVLCRGCNVSLGHYERFTQNRDGWADKLRAYLAHAPIVRPLSDAERQREDALFDRHLWVPRPGELPLAAARRRLDLIARGQFPRDRDRSISAPAPAERSEDAP